MVTRWMVESVREGTGLESCGIAVEAAEDFNDHILQYVDRMRHR